MKKRFILMLLLLLVFCVGANFTAMGKSKYVIKFNELNNPGHPHHVADLKFAELVSEKTNGRVEVRVYPSGQLGGGREAIEGCQLGTLEITMCMSANLSSWVPDFDVINFPYIFHSREHMYKVLKSEIGQNLKEEALEKVGLMGLMYFDSGARSIYNTRRPVYTPEDLRGLKLRVAENGLMIDTLNAMGAGAVPMPYGDIYSGMQQKLIDGAENSPVAYYYTNHYEIAGYLSLTNHFRAPDMAVMSLRYFKSLPVEYQKAVLAAAAEAQAYQWKIWVEEENEIIDKLKAAGVKINEVKNPALFTKKVEAIWGKYGKELSPGLIEKIQAVK